MSKLNHGGSGARALWGASLVGLAVGAAPSAQAQTGAAINQLRAAGSYLAGDKHNHTTCNDGSTSVRALIEQSVFTYDLDWFANAGHGGSYARDCRFSDPEYDGPQTGEGRFWVDTVGAGAIKGDFVATSFTVFQDPTTPQTDTVQAMWRWQSLRQWEYSQTREVVPATDPTPVWLGLEWIVPGHEHASTAVIDGQFPANGSQGDPFAMAQFEYLWDRADNDCTGAVDRNQDGVPEIPAKTATDPIGGRDSCTGGKAAGFENPQNNGVRKIQNIVGNHEKSVAAVAWMARNHPNTSYAVAAHLERAGAYVTTADAGFNVEHLRDWHSAGLLNRDDVTGPSVAFGMESQPGHQASGSRGEYDPGRPSACLVTFGGTGCYVGAVASLPGVNFDGTPIDTTAIPGVPAGTPPERVVLGQPGVGGLWDSMLGEGRRFFTFASSDWHNRGAFGPFQRESTFDFWPGEYQKTYAFAPAGAEPGTSALPRALIRGMREGNSWHVMGDLIDELYWVACYSETGECVTLGEELQVSRARGGRVQFELRVRDPRAPNRSIYSFPNPSLAQIGIEQPLDRPELHHVDVIAGQVFNVAIERGDPRYTTVNTNPTTRVIRTFDEGNWTREGLRIAMRWSVPVADMPRSMYYRLRGTNLPQGLPNETDADGNPLPDSLAVNIPCRDRACPDHLPVDPGTNRKITDFDVEGWSDLWFYSNPIFVRVNGNNT